MLIFDYMSAGSIWQPREQTYLGMWCSRVPGCYTKLIDTVLTKRYCASSSLGCVKHWKECSVYKRHMAVWCLLHRKVKNKHQELTYIIHVLIEWLVQCMWSYSRINKRGCYFLNSLTRSFFHPSFIVARSAVYLFNDMFQSKLNLVMGKG